MIKFLRKLKLKIVDAFNSTLKSERTCPVCKKSNQVVEIVYSFPSDELIRMYEQGKIKLGGCMIFNNSPKNYCKRDEKKFGIVYVDLL